MGILSAIVLYLVIWFMTLLVIIPIRLQSQGEQGDIVPGTHAGSPANPQMKKRFFWTSVIAAGLWVLVASIIIFGDIGMRDLDWFNRMGPPAAGGTDG